VSIGVKKNTSYAVEIEDTEGTYKAPQAATSYVQTQVDGAEISGSKELLDRNIFTASVGKTSPLVGQTQATGSLPVEARAHSLEGHAPEYDALMKSAMGNRRQITTTTTTKTGNTSTVLQIQDADIGKFNVGDIVMVKKAGAFHVSPLTAKSTGTGTASITLLVPHPSGTIPDNVVVSKSTTYIVADSGHPSLSVSKYIDGTVLENAVGCKVKSMDLANFQTGQLPSIKFGFEGLNATKSVTSSPYTPSYDTAQPPIMLDGRVYMDGASIDVNELAVKFENTLGFQTSINAPNGRISSRVTQRSISGTFNPFKMDDSVANFTKFSNNTAFSFVCIRKGSDRCRG
jgi:hypothetical protein